MKHFMLILLISFVALTAGIAQQAKITYHNDQGTKEAEKNGAVATFDKMVNDFGEIPQGIPKTATFTLTNNGKEPLLISYAKASCGCTNLSYDSEPVLPGKSTKISATYNAAAPGPFIKTITIRTNADANQAILQIKGTVITKEQPAADTLHL